MGIINSNSLRMDLNFLGAHKFIKETKALKKIFQSLHVWV